MELEKQVCSLELARRLRELAAKKESLFIWVDGKKPYVRDADMKGCGRCGAVVNGIMPPRSVPTYAAFTAVELGEMLPAGYKTTRGHDVFIVEGMPDEPHSIQRASTEADARARMLIYILENSDSHS